jgi:hypothetical protein
MISGMKTSGRWLISLLWGAAAWALALAGMLIFAYPVWTPFGGKISIDLPSVRPIWSADLDDTCGLLFAVHAGLTFIVGLCVAHTHGELTRPRDVGI